MTATAEQLYNEGVQLQTDHDKIVGLALATCVVAETLAAKGWGSQASAAMAFIESLRDLHTDLCAALTAKAFEFAEAQLETETLEEILEASDGHQAE